MAHRWALRAGHSMAVMAVAAVFQPASPTPSQDGGRFDAEYMTLADRIGETCYEMYRFTKTGLAPEYVKFSAGHDMQVEGEGGGRGW